nr:hypothetical protein [Tanacetum cinerariifolium]
MESALRPRRNSRIKIPHLSGITSRVKAAVARVKGEILPLPTKKNCIAASSSKLVEKPSRMWKASCRSTRSTGCKLSWVRKR